MSEKQIVRVDKEISILGTQGKKRLRVGEILLVVNQWPLLMMRCDGEVFREINGMLDSDYYEEIL